MSAGMRPAAPPFMTDGRAHPPSHTRAVDADADPNSDVYVFDFGNACELERERREPLLTVFADDDETLGDILDLDAALGCMTTIQGDEEPDTERTPPMGLT